MVAPNWERTRYANVGADNARVSRDVARRRAEMDAQQAQSDALENALYGQGVANQQAILANANKFSDWADQQSESTLPAMDQLVYQNLQAGARGQDVPFGQAQQAAYMTDANTRAQSAADAQIARLQEQAMASGGNMNDPSYQAAIRQAQSQAQSNMQNQRNAIAMQAGSANYAAKQQATQGLMGLQGQLANQALANRSQQGGFKGQALAAQQQALSMPVVKPTQSAWNNQAAKVPQPQQASYQLPSYQQWQQANQPKPPMADPNGWRNFH